METGGARGARTRPARLNSRRSRSVALVLMLVLIAIAVRLFVAAARTPPRDDLHGDGEDAPPALQEALARMSPNARLPYLLRSVNDPSPGLRYASVDELAQYHTPEAANAIEHAFQDSASIVRQRAVETLHTVDHERGIALLLTGLRDEDSWIREAAVTQLNRCPDTPGAAGAAKPGAHRAESNGAVTGAMVADRRAVPMLIRCLDDRDDVLPHQAVGLLKRLTGRGSEYKLADGHAEKQRVLADWRAWWAANSTQFAAPPALANPPQIRPTRADAAPDFAVKDVSGKTFSLASTRGRVTLLNFWGTWCPPCRHEIPNLERIQETFGSSGADVVGVAVAEREGDAGLRKWCAQHNLTYRQAMATDEIQSRFGHIEEVPVSVLIDKQSRIRYRWEGDRDYDTFRAAVERLLAE